MMQGTPRHASSRSPGLSVPGWPSRAWVVGAAALCLALSHPVAAQVAPPPAAQNPSPMVEETRPHQRLARRDIGGTRAAVPGRDGRPIELWIPSGGDRDSVHLLVHFHGAAWIAQQSGAALPVPAVVAVVNLGAGSGTYDRAFSAPETFDSLLAGVEGAVAAARGGPAAIGHVTLSGYSAGHGAIRAILREPRHFARVGAILLLDGMHTAYVPAGGLLATGATLDTRNLDGFVAFARAAMRGERRFVVTHSEIFPGTFASTTETADHLLRALGLRRAAVLRWGPRGMQQLGEVHAGGFRLLGFAGNSAPDHVDHLHAMPELLALALPPRDRSAPPITPRRPSPRAARGRT